ncbi:hypothetical protein [Aquipuribacter hungaricus]|uniref:Secreted protein n=1 Tax=Aquipuribacter hungaricus TaxID=545624 RepID=A0ABV7WLE8_9MICO
MDTTTTTVVVVVAVVALLLVVGVVAVVVRRRREREQRERLRQRFGSEYDRAVAGGDPRGAEARLARAARERDKLDVRPLDPASRRRRRAQWRAVQADFVEVPVEAVDAAHELVTEVMAERGYPTADSEQALTLLAADHAETVEHYRTAEQHRSRFRDGEGSTEDLRRAFVEYRSLFDVLVQEGAERGGPTDDDEDDDGSLRPDGTPMTADDYVRAAQQRLGAVSASGSGSASGQGEDDVEAVDIREDVREHLDGRPPRRAGADDGGATAARPVDAG